MSFVQTFLYFCSSEEKCQYIAKIKSMHINALYYSTVKCSKYKFYAGKMSFELRHSEIKTLLCGGRCDIVMGAIFVCYGLIVESRDNPGDRLMAKGPKLLHFIPDFNVQLPGSWTNNRLVAVSHWH